MSIHLQSIDLLRQNLGELPHLEDRFCSLQDALDDQNPGRIIDEAKCLLESIFRTISISYYGAESKERIDLLRMPDLFTEVSLVVSLSENKAVSGQLKEMCDLQFKRIGSIRNAEGASAHGRDGYHEPTVGLSEALYIAQSAVAIGALYYSRYREKADWRTNTRQKYEDNPDFNEWLDDQQDPIEIAGTVLTPSAALFSADPIAYRSALIEFMSNNEQN